MKTEDVDAFIRQGYTHLSKGEVVGLWSFSTLGALRNASVFWGTLPLHTDMVGIFYRIQFYFVLVIYFLLIVWGLKLLIGLNRKALFIKTRYLYGGSCFLLGAVIFLSADIKLLVLLSETQDIVFGLSLAMISLAGSIILGIATINRKIYAMTNSRKQKVMSATLAITIISVASMFGMGLARVFFSPTSINMIENTLMMFAIMTIMFFVLTWIAVMCYYRVYLLHKFGLINMLV